MINPVDFIPVSTKITTSIILPHKFIIRWKLPRHQVCIKVDKFLWILFKKLLFFVKLDESSEKKSKKTVTSSTSQPHKTSESEKIKPEETNIKAEKEKDEDSDKKTEKNDKKEKTASQSGPVLTSNEKSRRKQVEIEMKKWEKEQVTIIFGFFSIFFNILSKHK